VHVGDPIELLLHRSDSCLASVEEMPERLVRLPVGMHDRTAHVIRVEAHLKQGFRGKRRGRHGRGRLLGP
jgi:hypothetical protein